MADNRALVIVGGRAEQQVNADSLIVGAGSKTTTGVYTLNGVGGVDIQGNGTTALAINAAGTTATVQAGATLGTTGTGNIDLPNNASARFKIEGSAVTATVTSANLTTLTNGSNADALHSHTGGSTFSRLSGEALDAGELVIVDDSGGNPRVFKADANGAGELASAIGVVTTTTGGAGNAVTIQQVGEVSVPDTEWDSVPATSDVGKFAYLSETAGNWTLTAPTTSGSTVQPMGRIITGGTGAVKVAVAEGLAVVLA